MDDVKYAVVIVAFNDRRSTLQAARAYGAQEPSPAKIIIVDNSDEAEQRLPRTIPENPLIEVIDGRDEAGKNSGSAGGFAAGMRHAAARGYDVVILSDQDFLPRRGAACALLEVHRDFPDAAVSSVTVDPSDARVMPAFVASPPEAARRYGLPGLVPNNGDLVRAMGWRASGEVIKDVAAFTARFQDSRVAVTALASPQGLLLPRAVIQRIGVYREEFFTGLEDYEYCARLWDHQIPVLVALGAFGDHHLTWHDAHGSGPLTIKVYAGNAFRAYWAFRNSLVLARERTRRTRKLVWFLHDAYRAVVYVALGLPDSRRSRLTAVGRAWRDAMWTHRGASTSHGAAPRPGSPGAA